MKVFIIVMAVALVGLVGAKSSTKNVQIACACEGCQIFFANIKNTLEDTDIQNAVAKFADTQVCSRVQAAGDFLVKACGASFKILVPLGMEWVAGQVLKGVIACYAVGSCRP